MDRVARGTTEALTCSTAMETTKCGALDALRHAGDTDVDKEVVRGRAIIMGVELLDVEPQQVVRGQAETTDWWL